MVTFGWPNQKFLVCPLAYITSVMTSPAFKAHLEAPPLGLVGSFTPFELERGETMCHKLERERDGELALTPLEGGPLCLHLLTFLLLRVAFGPLSHGPWSLGFNACMLTCFSHPMDG